VDRIVKVTMAAYFLCVVSGASLYAMEKELQKTEDSCWLQQALFAAQEMKKQHGMPHEVAAIVVQKSYLLRNAEIYQKFDSFFHFDNDNYGAMNKKRSRAIEVYIQENVVDDNFADDRERIEKQIEKMREYEEKHPFNIALCRKCDVIAPYNLFFLTEKQDAILLRLISSQCFALYEGQISLNFGKEEYYKQYLILPPMLLELLSKYSINKSWQYPSLDADELTKKALKNILNKRQKNNTNECNLSSDEKDEEVVSSSYFGSLISNLFNI
jgi:hypothetical protein